MKALVGSGKAARFRDRLFVNISAGRDYSWKFFLNPSSAVQNREMLSKEQ